MSLKDILSTVTALPTLLQMKKELRPGPADTCDSLGRRMELVCERFADRPAIIFEGKNLTWREFNAHTNRYAHCLKSLGLQRGDTVSVIMENRVEFLCTVAALNKLGAVAALINTNLTGNSLVHCMKITGSKMCIFGEERAAAIAEVRDSPELAGLDTYLYVPDSGGPCPAWASDLEQAARAASEDNPPDAAQTTIEETSLNIFTSGTTGFPKASVVSHRRQLFTSILSYKGGIQCKETDCIYLCLPLYHGTGLFLGFGAALSTGACMFVRRKFSASKFLSEVREHNTTCFIYIGELCRYLLNTPPSGDDADTPLTRVMGNGLRPDIWHEFKQRFGIERVAEFYGSSEGNVGFVNMLNKDCTVGTTAVPMSLVKYDVDADEVVRDSRGRLQEVAIGEPGLLLGKITELTRFEGYTSEEDTQKKILRDGFEDGDAWFNTGDLMRQVDVGFALGLPHFQFVDRVGDTFRWKSENVSTNEVGEIVNGHPQVDFCNVYGVTIPGADGKAGMAAIVLAEGTRELDLDSFSAYVNQHLPAYARPVFLRIQREIDTTGTFKMVKGDLRKQGYDPAQVGEPLFVMKPRAESYEPLDETFFAVLRDGAAGY